MSEAAADRALHPMLQDQFDTMGQQAEASTLGMWVFLGTEVLFFGGLFLAYLVYRSWFPEAFLAGSTHMDTTLGTVNTAVLILSSFTVAMAILGGQRGDRRLQVAMLALTIVLGGIFLGIKVYEYRDHISHHLYPGAAFVWDGDPGLAPQVQLFFALYFIMTGLHAVHMVVGLGIMGVMLAQARRGRFGPEYHTPLEVSGLYWHFVDIVWIFLFPLLYLLGLHGTGA